MPKELDIKDIKNQKAKKKTEMSSSELSVDLDEEWDAIREEDEFIKSSERMLEASKRYKSFN